MNVEVNESRRCWPCETTSLWFLVYINCYELSREIKEEPFAMSLFFGKREAVGSGTERKSSVQRSIYGAHKYSGRQLPPFFTFQSDTPPSLFSEYTFFVRCSISSRFVERDRTLHQGSHQFLVLLLNAAHGHRQHDTK